MEQKTFTPTEQPEDLTNYAVAIYQDNKAKGFWDGENLQLEKMMLVQSEMFEAFEAFRKGMVEIELKAIKELVRLIPSGLFYQQNCMRDSYRAEMYSELFKGSVKDTLQDELADTIIRLLDWAGSKDIEIVKPDVNNFALRPLDDFLQIMFDFNAAIHMLYKMKITTDEISDVIFYLVDFAIHNEIDIWLHIELKLAYNRTREHKHGKKF